VSCLCSSVKRNSMFGFAVFMPDKPTSYLIGRTFVHYTQPRVSFNPRCRKKCLKVQPKKVCGGVTYWWGT
jgi:hypothetical protein